MTTRARSHGFHLRSPWCLYRSQILSGIVGMPKLGAQRAIFSLSSNAGYKSEPLLQK